MQEFDFKRWQNEGLPVVTREGVVVENLRLVGDRMDFPLEGDVGGESRSWTLEGKEFGFTLSNDDLFHPADVGRSVLARIEEVRGLEGLTPEAALLLDLAADVTAGRKSTAEVLEALRAAQAGGGAGK